MMLSTMLPMSPAPPSTDLRRRRRPHHSQSQPKNDGRSSCQRNSDVVGADGVGNKSVRLNLDAIARLEAMVRPMAAANRIVASKSTSKTERRIDDPQPAKHLRSNNFMLKLAIAILVSLYIAQHCHVVVRRRKMSSSSPPPPPQSIDVD